MDEEVITWNLKGPKRMRKRRELNALLKNNLKYKSLLKNQTSNNCSLDLDQTSRRLFNNLNDSSSDNDEFYFSANKSYIKQKRRTYFCKIFQMILIGFVITFILLIGIILVFSYTKFHDVLIDLKSELNSQNEQNQKSLERIKLQMKEYDNLFKKLNQDTSIEKLSGLERNSSTNLIRSIRSIDIGNRLNSYLIEWLFNKTSNQKQYSLKNLLLLNKTNQNSVELTNFLNYNSLIEQFINNEDKGTKNQFKHLMSEISNSKSNNNSEIFESFERIYIKPLLNLLDNCKCNT